MSFNVNLSGVMFDGETGELVVPVVRQAFAYDRDVVSVLTGLSTPENTLAQQQFLEDCDINTIVKRFGLTGELPAQGSVRAPLEGDFRDVVDFQTAMNIVRMGEEAFMEMPAEVRNEFANDPARFVSFVNDERNYDRAVELGIAMKRPEAVVPEPTLVRVVADPPAGGGTSST